MIKETKKKHITNEGQNKATYCEVLPESGNIGVGMYGYN
jgi:hypothetical protein